MRTKLSRHDHPLRRAGAALPARAAGTLNLVCAADVKWCELMEREFEASHDIDVNMVRMSSGEAYARLRAEARNPKTDVWWAGTGDPHLQAADDNLTLEYKSPMLDQLQPWAQKQAEVSGYKTVGVYSGALGWGYNTQIWRRRASPHPPAGRTSPTPSTRARSRSPTRTRPAPPTRARHTRPAHGRGRGLRLPEGAERQYHAVHQVRLPPGEGGGARRDRHRHRLHARCRRHDQAGLPVETVAPLRRHGLRGRIDVDRQGRQEHLENAKVFYDWALSPKVQSKAAEATASSCRPTRARPCRPKAPKLDDIKLIDYDFAKYGNAETRKALLERWTARSAPPPTDPASAGAASVPAIPSIRRIRRWIRAFAVSMGPWLCPRRFRRLPWYGLEVASGRSLARAWPLRRTRRRAFFRSACAPLSGSCRSASRSPRPRRCASSRPASGGADGWLRRRHRSRPPDHRRSGRRIRWLELERGSPCSASGRGPAAVRPRRLRAGSGVPSVSVLRSGRAWTPARRRVRAVGHRAGGRACHRLRAVPARQPLCGAPSRPSTAPSTPRVFCPTSRIPRSGRSPDGRTGSCGLAWRTVTLAIFTGLGTTILASPSRSSPRARPFVQAPAAPSDDPAHHHAALRDRPRPHPPVRRSGVVTQGLLTLTGLDGGSLALRLPASGSRRC